MFMLRSSFLTSLPSRVPCVKCQRTSLSRVTWRRRQREASRLHCSVLPHLGGPITITRKGSRAMSKLRARTHTHTHTHTQLAQDMAPHLSNAYARAGSATQGIRHDTHVIRHDTRLHHQP